MVVLMLLQLGWCLALQQLDMAVLPNICKLSAAAVGWRVDVGGNLTYGGGSIVLLYILGVLQAQLLVRLVDQV